MSNSLIPGPPADLIQPWILQQTARLEHSERRSLEVTLSLPPTYIPSHISASPLTPLQTSSVLGIITTSSNPDKASQDLCNTASVFTDDSSGVKPHQHPPRTSRTLLDLINTPSDLIDTPRLTPPTWAASPAAPPSKQTAKPRAPSTSPKNPSAQYTTTPPAIRPPMHRKTFPELCTRALAEDEMP